MEQRQTPTVTPETVFSDADTLMRGALARLEAGDVRDAAEKAWGATLRATNALVLARRGFEPERSRDTATELLRLATQDPRAEALAGRYYTRQGKLHGDCFYYGLCEPLEDTIRRIRETADYIRDGRTLAT